MRSGYQHFVRLALRRPWPSQAKKKKKKKKKINGGPTQALARCGLSPFCVVQLCSCPAVCCLGRCGGDGRGVGLNESDCSRQTSRPAEIFCSVDHGRLECAGQNTQCVLLSASSLFCRLPAGAHALYFVRSTHDFVIWHLCKATASSR